MNPQDYSWPPEITGTLRKIAEIEENEFQVMSTARSYLETCPKFDNPEEALLSLMMEAYQVADSEIVIYTLKASSLAEIIRQKNPDSLLCEQVGSKNELPLPEFLSLMEEFKDAQPFQITTATLPAFITSADSAQKFLVELHEAGLAWNPNEAVHDVNFGDGLFFHSGQREQVQRLMNQVPNFCDPLQAFLSLYYENA